MSKTLKKTIHLVHDEYNGVAIDVSTIPNDIDEFEKELNNIIQKIENKKLLWIKLPIEKSYIIPMLISYDFLFHHCNEKDITMLKKLIDNPIIPTAINHTLGVGAVVIEDNKILVIKDKKLNRYKLPGGYIDDKENISQAVQREVFEETGIEVELTSIVSLRHITPAQFEESNLYVVCSAKALSHEINIVDSEEILEAKWMSIDDYFNDDDIHIYTKNLVKNAMKHRGLEPEIYDYFTSVDTQYEYYFFR